MKHVFSFRAARAIQTLERGGASLSRIEFAAAACLMILLAGLLYLPSLHGPFVLDDNQNIVDNPRVHIQDLGPESLLHAALDGSKQKRPAARLTFALNYYFNGLDPAGFRTVNIFLLGLTGAVLFALFRTLLILPYAAPIPGRPSLIALAGALVWMVHPVQTQSISYIVQRMNAMAGLFCALSLLSYLRGRLQPDKRFAACWFFLSCLAFILGAASKQNAAMLPLFIILAEWMFFQDMDRKWAAKAGLLMGAAMAGLLLMGFLYAGNIWTVVRGSFECREFTLLERVLTQFRVVGLLYVSLLIFPHPAALNLDHDYPISRSLLDPPSTLAGLAIILILVGGAAVAARKNRLEAFCIAWFLGNLAMESSILPLEMVFEHRLFMPSMLPCLLAALLVRRLGFKGFCAVMCLVIAVFGFWTWQRNTVWAGPVALFGDGARKSPEKMRPVRQYALALTQAGDHPLAVAHYQKAMSLEDAFIEKHAARAEELNRAGESGRAEVHAELARRVTEWWVEDSNNLAFSLGHYPELDSGRRLKLAMQQYQASLERDADNLTAHGNLGRIYASLNQPSKAVAHYRRALRFDPEDASMRARLGDALNKAGDVEGAAREYQRVLAAAPGQADPEALARAHVGLGAMLVRHGDYERGLPHMEQAVNLLPEHLGIQDFLEQVKKERFMMTEEGAQSD